MADVLNVIADILKQDKQQKREHARMMREVQKKLKEKEVEASEDNADFMGAASQAAADGKKEFEFPPGSGKMYPVTIKDKDTAKKIAKKMDDEDEQEEELSLGDRVKARMNSQKEDDEPEMDDDDDVGMSSDQLDKIADLVVQKLKDKAEDEMDDEEEPEATEAESGKETPVDTKPKMESISRNPHHRGMWAEALRKVYENTQIDEHCGECEESIEEKKGSDYELYHKTFSAAMQHAYAVAKKKGYTVDPDEIDNKVASGPRKPSSGKTNRYILGTDKKQKLHVQVANLDNKRYELNMYIEGVELDEGVKLIKTDYDLDQMVLTFDVNGTKQQFVYWDYEEDWKNTKPKDVLDQLSKEKWYNSLDRRTKTKVLNSATKSIRSEGVYKEDVELDEKWKKGKYTVRDGNTGKVIATFDSGAKASKEMHKLLDSGKYDELEVKMEGVEIDEKKMFSGKGEFEVKYASSKRGPIKVSKFNTLDDAKKFLAQVKGEGMNGIISKGGKPVKEEVEESVALQMKMAADDIETYAKKHGGIDKKDMMKAAAMLKKGDKKGALKFIKTLDTDPRDYLLKTMGEEVEIDESGWGSEPSKPVAGYIAMYRGKKVEIKKGKGKGEADGIFPAKELAYKLLKVPKSKQGLVAIEPAYEEVVLEENDKAMMMKLTTKAMKAIPNSPQQKELIKQVNVYRKKLGMKPMREDYSEFYEDKKYHYYNLDRGVYRLQKDNNGKIIGKMHDRQKEMRAGFPNADEVLSTTKQAAAKVAKLNEALEEKASDYEDQIKAFLAKGGKIQKGDRPNKRKIDKVTNAFLKKYGVMKKKEADLDAKDKEELEKMMDEAVVLAYQNHLLNETWIDNDAKKVQPKWKKMDKRAKKMWMDGILAKAKKEGMPKDEVMDVLDDYGLVENFNENESLGVRFARKFYQKDKD